MESVAYSPRERAEQQSRLLHDEIQRLVVAEIDRRMASWLSVQRAEMNSQLKGLSESLARRFLALTEHIGKSHATGVKSMRTELEQHIDQVENRLVVAMRKERQFDKRVNDAAATALRGVARAEANGKARP